MRPTLCAAACAGLLLHSSLARAATEIDFFFPVPVQGRLSNEMQRLVSDFNARHPDIHVTPSYTGSYDDTNLKTHAAIQAGHSPAVVLMSANFVREYVITGDAVSLDPFIAADGQSDAQYMDKFWPALRTNAMEAGQVYGVPFQNSTPVLYYNTDAFKEAGLDPDHPPTTWAEWAEDARKLTKRDGTTTTRYGLEMVTSYDTLGWLLSGLAMSNGGQYYDQAWGGEVYYNQPSTLGAVQFLDNLVHVDHAMPEGVTDANTVAAAFFSGRAAMIVNSTGALGFVRDGMKQPYRVAFIPRALRNAVPIGGGSLIIPRGNSPERERAAWTFINEMSSPAVAGGWSRFTGYFAPNRHAYEMPEMQSYLAEHPDAKVALDQLQYAQPWFATYATVAVRKAMEDQVQAVLSGRIKPADAVVAAQKAADDLLRPYAERTALDVAK